MLNCRQLAVGCLVATVLMICFIVNRANRPKLETDPTISNGKQFVDSGRQQDDLKQIDFEQWNRIVEEHFATEDMAKTDLSVWTSRTESLLVGNFNLAQEQP